MTKAQAPKAAKRTSFDFAELEDRIVAASRRAFKEVRRAHKKERICGFALYSDEGAMTVCPAFDLLSHREERVADQDADADYYTFATAEWALEGFGAAEAFDQICTDVRTFVSAQKSGFAAFKKALFETCVRALERLRAEGAFDEVPGLLVRFAVSDASPHAAQELRWMKRLNQGSPYVEQFRKWTKTWSA